MEEINCLQKNMVKLQKDIEYIKLALIENKTDCKEMVAKIEEWIESSDKRFAPKWVENVLIWLGVATGGVLIVALLELIIKQ